MARQVSTLLLEHLDDAQMEARPDGLLFYGLPHTRMKRPGRSRNDLEDNPVTAEDNAKGSRSA